MLAIVLAACSGTSPVLGPDDDGTMIDLVMGDEILVELPSNPSTGYSWQVADPGPCNAPDGSQFVQDSQDEDLVGSGGIERFVFVRNSQEGGELRMEYRRPWEDRTVSAESVWKIRISSAK